MLYRQHNQEDTPAAEMRAGKEELARAIAALEARRNAEAQRLEGTAVIGEVLEQLQVNASPEEVLHEIEAIREGRPHEEPSRRRVWSAERVADAKLVSGIVLVPFAAILVAFLTFNPDRPPKPIAGGRTGQAPLWIMPSPTLPPGATGEIMDEGGFNASSVLKPLAAVPDDQPIHCNTTSLTRLFTNPQAEVVTTPQNVWSNLDSSALARSTQLFDVRPNLHKPWVLIKHGQKLYLRGWVAAYLTKKQIQQRPIVLHSSSESFELGVHPVHITLPASFHAELGSIETTPFPTATPVIAIYHANLDEHAYEKWQP
jgi:hypothetical protein